MTAMNVSIINLTPHTINVMDYDGGATEKLPPSGNVARVSTVSRLVGTTCGYITGIPLYETEYGDVTGLPPRQPDTFLVVSAMVVAACPDRTDLYSPGELIRNDAGQVVGCRGLTRPARKTT